jgi:hypothetical protein
MYTLFGRDAGDAVLVTARVLAAWPTGAPAGFARPAYAKRRVELSTASSGPACGYGFVPGETFLVYAEGLAEDLIASTCSRTRTLEEAKEDLEELGPPAIDRRGAGARQ